MGKKIVTKSLQKLPKWQQIAISGHTDSCTPGSMHVRFLSTPSLDDMSQSELKTKNFGCHFKRYLTPDFLPFIIGPVKVPLSNCFVLAGFRLTLYTSK